MSDKSLAGQWALVAESSDRIPGLGNTEGAPITAAITKGNVLEEHLLIRQVVSSRGDEATLTFTPARGRIPFSATYEIGSINIDNSASAGPVLSVIVKADKHFHEMSILRLGPSRGRRSLENFRLDATGLQMTTTTEFTMQYGQSLVFIKYFRREALMEVPRPLEYRHHSKSIGWDNLTFRSLDILETVSMAIIRVLSINDSAAKKEAIGDKVEIAHIIGRHSNSTSFGSNVVLFIIQVVQGSLKWFVGHRYSEFESLKRFIASELTIEGDPATPSTSTILTGAPPFPEKRLSFMTSARLEQRKEGLEAYLNYFIDNKAGGSHNVCDALLAFLEIPQHLQAHEMAVQHARKKLEAEQAAREAAQPKFRRVSLANFGSSLTPAAPAQTRSSSMVALEKSTGEMSLGENPAAPKARRPSMLQRIGLTTAITPPEPPPVLSETNLQQVAGAGQTPTKSLDIGHRKRSGSMSSADSDSSTYSNYVSSSVPNEVLARRPSAAPPVKSNAEARSSSAQQPTDAPIQPPSVSAASPSTTARKTAAVIVTPALANGSVPTTASEKQANVDLNKALSGPSDYHQYPQDALHAAMQTGILVLKHGRTGRPKKRLLRCDHAVSRLYWSKPNDEKPSFLGRRRSSTNASEEGGDMDDDLPSEAKSVVLADVIRIQKGTDLDASEAASAAAANSPADRRTSLSRRMSFALSSTHSEDKPLLGTATLRRTCKPEDLELCFSLILPSRSFDIQCLNKADYDLLYNNLEKLLRQTRT